MAEETAPKGWEHSAARLGQMPLAGKQDFFPASCALCLLPSPGETQPAKLLRCSRCKHML